jgi:hypothetical protein
MDLLNKAKGAMSGGSSSGQQPAAGQPGAPAGGQKDYGDKGTDYSSIRSEPGIHYAWFKLIETYKC